jgi:hypothetical protein
VITWLVTVFVLSFLIMLRFQTVPAGPELPECADCRYDLSGISTYAPCPECNSVKRAVQAERIRFWLEPSWSRVAVVWATFMLVLLALRVGEGVGIYLSHRIAASPRVAWSWGESWLGFWGAVLTPDVAVVGCLLIFCASLLWRLRGTWTVVALGISWALFVGIRHGLADWYAFRLPSGQSSGAAQGELILGAVVLFIASLMFKIAKAAQPAPQGSPPEEPR